MIKANIDAQGFVIGYYDTGIIDEANIPEGAIELTQEEYDLFMVTEHYRSGDAWVVLPTKPHDHVTWDNGVWVEDIDAKETQEALDFLEMTDKEQARSVDDILENLLNGTPIPQVVLDRQEARKIARGKLGN